MIPTAASPPTPASPTSPIATFNEAIPSPIGTLGFTGHHHGDPIRGAQLSAGVACIMV